MLGALGLLLGERADLKSLRNKELKCVVTNNELEEDLWWGLVQKPEMAMNIYLAIAPEIEFNEADKKK